MKPFSFIAASFLALLLVFSAHTAFAQLTGTVPDPHCTSACSGGTCTDANNATYVCTLSSQDGSTGYTGYTGSTNSSTQINSFSTLVSAIITVINDLIPFLFGLAVLGFMWGVIKYILADGPDKLAEARNYMVFGIIGLAVMMAVWSLAFFVKDSFFPNSQTPINVGGRTS